MKLLPLLLLLLFGLASQPAVAGPLSRFAQVAPPQCSDTSQRVCSDDYRSCSDLCTAQSNAPDVGEDTTSCATRCCINYSACLSNRSCSSTGIGLNCE